MLLYIAWDQWSVLQAQCRVSADAHGAMRCAQVHECDALSKRLAAQQEVEATLTTQLADASRAAEEAMANAAAAVSNAEVSITPLHHVPEPQAMCKGRVPT